MPSLPCLRSSFRRTSRALTQIYEEALRPLGLRAGQFSILQVLSRTGEVPQGRIGEMMVMDSTTLTRTLDIMLRQGWIGMRRGEDRRERWWQLSGAGRALLNRALPVWAKVQTRLRRQLGTKEWGVLLQLTDEAAQRVRS